MDSPMARQLESYLIHKEAPGSPAQRLQNSALVHQFLCDLRHRIDDLPHMLQRHGDGAVLLVLGLAICLHECSIVLHDGCLLHDALELIELFGEPPTMKEPMLWHVAELNLPDPVGLQHLCFESTRDQGLGERAHTHVNQLASLIAGTVRFASPQVWWLFSRCPQTFSSPCQGGPTLLRSSSKPHPCRLVGPQTPTAAAWLVNTPNTHFMMHMQPR